MTHLEPITLRDATPADIPALSALGHKTFIDTFGHLYSAANLARFLDETHSIAALTAAFAVPGARWQLAEQGGALVGYCKVGPLGLPVETGGRQAMELKQLYVLADQKGAGLADQLMAWAMEACEAAGAEDVYLSVYSDNPRAQRFYQRHGFAWHADYFFMVGDHRDEEFIYRKVMRP